MNRVHILLLLILAWAISAHAQNLKLSNEFANANSMGAVDIIVKFKIDPTEDPNDLHHQKLIQRGGILKTVHHIIRSASYRIDADQLADLANDPPSSSSAWTIP
jgi:hypothetical protein